METGYDGTEKRTSCRECISHREHSNQLKNMEKDIDRMDDDCRENTRDMWSSIKEKVPYKQFLAAVGFIVTAMAVVSTLNWNMMNKVLDSNHRVELKVTQIEEQVKGTNTRMDDFSARLVTYENEHNFFRKAILDLMRTRDAKAEANVLYNHPPPPSNFPQGD